MARLAGKRALISGAANGMGAAMARLFVVEGARVVITDIELDPLQQLAGELGDVALALKLDVTSERDWQDAASRTESAFGGLDILINNAGVFRLGMITKTSADDFDFMYRTNQLSCFLGTKFMSPLMIASDGGAIVNLSSGAGLRGSKGQIAYASAKWAVRGMTKCAALELAPYKIRVNSIHPGMISTRMIQGIPKEASNVFIATTPLSRIGDPIEVAELALFLSSDASRYMTGTEQVIDGGLSV